MLAYLAARETVDAARFNALYAEFERKVGLILSHKSPILARHIHPGIQRLLGRVVYFVTSGARAYTSGATAHDEAVYDAAVAGATVTSWDAATRIAHCDSTAPTVDDSLIARWVLHSGARYYLQQPGRKNERRHPYGVLDVVVEGPTSLDFPQEWDKYGLIRVHNCNLLDGLMVTFEGEFPEEETELEFTVPRGECRTYRIDRNAAGVPVAVEESGIYFWTARPTDPCPAEPKLGDYQPYQSYRASNILHPRLLLDWIAALTTSDIKSELGWEIDWSVLAEVEASYATAFYGDPSVTTTLLGDLIHHRGNLYVERTGYDSQYVAFPGYASIAGMTDLVRVVSDGAGAYEIERLDEHVTYVSGVTTNLLEDGSGAHGTINLTSGTSVALASVVNLVAPGASDPYEIAAYLETEEVEVTASYLNAADELVVVMGTYDQLTGTPETAVEYSFAPSDTVAAVAARSELLTLTDAALTPWGPAWVFDRELDVSLPGWVWHSGTQTLFLPGHGWPSGDSDGDIETEVPVHRHVLWPRPPQVIRPTGITDPPDATGLIESTDGAPWQVAPASVKLPGAFTAKRSMLPLDTETALISGQWWRTWAIEGGTARLPRTAEEYNWLAWRCNQLRRGRPLSLGDIRFTVDGGVASLVPNARSYTDPVDFFCAAESLDSTQAALLALCGASYSTFLDYPARWQTIHAAFNDGGNKHVTTPTIPVTNSTPVKSFDGSTWRVDWTETYGAPYAAVVATTGELMVGLNAPITGIDWPTYRWVSDAAAITVASSVGVPMIRTRLCRGQKIVLEHPQAPTLLWQTHIASLAREHTGMVNEWEADAYIATIPPTSEIWGGPLSEYRYSENATTWDGATKVICLPAQTEGDVDFVIPVIYDNMPMPADRTRENLIVKFDADGITKTGTKSDFYSWGTRIGVAAWQTTRTDDWWKLFAGSHQTMLAVTTFSDGFGLRSYSRAALTPSYLFDRAVPDNTSEGQHDRLATLYTGGSDPREPTYIAPAPGEAQIVTWSGKLKVLSPPGSAKAALVQAELIVGVDLEWVPEEP